MKKLLLTTLFVLAGCGSEAVNPDPVTPPAPTCDFYEFTVAPQDPTNGQFIATLPVFSEYSVCGNNTHTFDPQGATTIDSDFYLFPMVTNEDFLHVNFKVDTNGYHTPIVNFYVIYDDIPPIQVGHFIGASTALSIIDWPIPVTGLYKNDLVVEVTSYVTVPFNLVSSEDYTLKFW
tara:strand:- start:2267 stop:2794 length:528 start_codon:yes stop_codon:yes gene_type:complete